MKIQIDIEATPQEIRSFFGLPDLEPLQREIVDVIRKNMSAGIDGFDPMTVMKPFILPEQSQAFTSLQKSFWNAMMGHSSRNHKSEDDKEHSK